jgi:hypothetical protein
LVTAQPSKQGRFTEEQEIFSIAATKLAGKAYSNELIKQTLELR